MSRIIVRKRAVRYLQRLPKPQKERVKTALRELENKPLEFPGIKQMLGEWAGWHRIRIGDMRVIFWFDEDEDIVYIDHIGYRGDVYKKR
jgi:mRNA interferase RelE/StbE